MYSLYVVCVRVKNSKVQNNIQKGQETFLKTGTCQQPQSRQAKAISHREKNHCFPNLFNYFSILKISAMTQYRHLFFDLDNTLYDFDANAFLAMKEAFSQLKITPLLPSFEEYFRVYIRINDALWAQYREQKLPKEILRGKRHTDSLAEFGVMPPCPPHEIDDLYLQVMTTQTNLFPGTEAVLGELKKRGYKIHIITNGFKEVQHDKLANTGLNKFLTDVYISEEIKSPKPSHEIFEHAIKSSNARKKESLMIGDSWESDIIGAKNFGIDQVFYNPQKKEVDYTGFGQPTFTIYKLEELLKIL
jgi:putative hydrolase of the HAD superfamily